jgi:hypothetical protein
MPRVDQKPLINLSLGWKPLLPSVAAGAIETRQVTYPFRRMRSSPRRRRPQRSRPPPEKWM